MSVRPCSVMLYVNVLLGFCVCFQTLVFNKTLNSSVKQLQFPKDLWQGLFPQQGPWGLALISASTPKTHSTRWQCRTHSPLTLNDESAGRLAWLRRQSYNHIIICFKGTFSFPVIIVAFYTGSWLKQANNTVTTTHKGYLYQGKLS